MKYLIVFLLLLNHLLSSQANTCFESDDPTLFHHVNVITGHLNMCFEDAAIEGGLPLTITRVYSSGGALIRDSTFSDYFFDQGWTIFPHLKMKLNGNIHKPFDESLRIELFEKGGSPVKYGNTKCTKHHTYLYPVSFSKKGSGSLSSRKRSDKNYIEIDTKEKVAILYAADGSIRYYKELQKNRYHFGYWYLTSEVLPSKHRITYYYQDSNLSRIELQNPSGAKTLAWIKFDTEKTDDRTCIVAATSDGKALTYQMFSYQGYDYVEDVSSNCRPREHYAYESGRKGTGARVNAMEMGGKFQFSASYYCPSDDDEEKQWANKIPKNNYSADKVHILKARVGPNNTDVPIAEFTYFEKYTDVRDVEHCLTRYHHTDDRLKAIEYFDKNDQLHSVLKFFWEKDKLCTKALFDPQGKPLFAKTFDYDDKGNVKEEVFRGNFSGSPTSALTIDEKGTARGAEAIVKHYKYEKDLLIEEIEIGGLTTFYEYKLDTDLLAAKFTSCQGKIILREFYTYDDNHLLIREIIDDGNTRNETDLTGITERRLKYYARYPDNGLCYSIRENYLDPATKKELQLSYKEFSYSSRNQIDREKVADANNRERYTLRIDQDFYGNIKRKTTPLGYENTYDYDSLGNLKESKEVGKLRKIIDYDDAGRPIQCTEKDDKGYKKITKTTYDAKGRPLTQIDSKDNTTTQSYDCFGNCFRIQFPGALDETSAYYAPSTLFEHDIQGNLISHIDPLGYKTTTTYNTLRKPIKIDYPDGSTIRHIYNTNGTLAKTIHPDGTEDHYTYDHFHRMRSKQTFSLNQEFLSQEEWTYDTFHLRSYTNPEGLKTVYTYDGAGRKIKEQAGTRVLQYTYDSLGNLEKTTCGGYTKVTLHDVEGNIFKQWEEDCDGKIENLTTFHYDHERRKDRAIRLTSQGEATDTFSYDPEGRLARHTDPLGKITQFIYSEETTNELGQKVLTKTTIDQLGNIEIETYDALNRLKQIEKKGPDEQTVSKERILYDRAGNRAARQTTIYHGTEPAKTYTTQWNHDSRGRVIREIEEQEKITTLKYDIKGRLRKKKYPNGKAIKFTYDGLDRLTTLHSSDDKLHYEYRYKFGSTSPHTAQDKLNNLLWIRTYNSFGQLTNEKLPNGAALKWDYDDLGRCFRFTLPDKSYIQYTYNDLHLTDITRLTSSNDIRYTHSYTDFDENGHIRKEELIKNLGTLTSTRDLLERPKEQSSPWNTAVIDYGPSGLVRQIENSLFTPKQYEYDPLDQLQQEGNKTYSFDSLGNPLDAKVNQYNQIQMIDDTTLIYDDNGNPRNRFTAHGLIEYKYDPLNRLIAIEKPNQPPVHFQYDPFSRLYSKQDSATHYYLYDKDIEIGLFNEHKKIVELKVLGLGIEGDIGAAVALELQGQVYAPLHDFSGNIIAIVSHNGQLAEKYEISAFGEENCSSTPINPWRFNSKRSEEGLVFFGLRFYDPKLGRWLTPDPAGSIDSPNLYLYVRNSPLNRLDLFGLDSITMIVNYDDQFYHNSIPTSFNTPGNTLIPLRVTTKDIQVDWLISSNIFHKIKCTPEEMVSGVIDITKHFHEMFPKQGQFIAITSLQNGVNTSFEELIEMSHSVLNMIGNKDHTFIGMHNPTDGFIRDGLDTIKEMRNRDTPIASLTRQALVAIAESVYRLNPDLIHLHISHSEGGAIYNCAFNGMTPEQQNLLTSHLYFIGVAPASPISNKQAMTAYNFYSKRDAITGTFGLRAKSGKNKDNYNIQMLKPISNRKEMNLYRYDHKFMGTTYQLELNETIQLLKDGYGFF